MAFYPGYVSGIQSRNILRYLSGNLNRCCGSGSGFRLICVIFPDPSCLS
jgi:hypothetical protein